MGRFAFITACLCLCLPTFAQVPQIDEQLRVNLIELEVKAFDLMGNFVSGLSAEDFVVKENGKVQDLDSLKEIRLDKLSPDDAKDYKSRVMLLLDVINTSYPVMVKVFPQVRDFIQTSYDGRCEIGLALFTNGIIEVTPFTTDQEELFDAVDRAEDFHRRNKLRAYGKPGTDNGGLSDRFISDYHRPSFDVFAQFASYLGAYTGKKNLIIISERWNAEKFGAETDRDNEKTISLRDLQTICLYNKVAINAISLTRGTQFQQSFGPSRRTGTFYLEPSADLAALTSGVYSKIPLRSVTKSIEDTIKKAEHYYRIRYYSDYSGDKYRKIQVSVKGLNRIARYTDGYYPRPQELIPADVGAKISFNQDFAFDLEMATEWMHWEWFGWGKRRANYAIAQRAYNPEGQLLAEHVFFDELAMRSGGYKEPLKKRFVFDLPLAVKPYRFETTILDLSTGKKVDMEQFTKRDR